MRRSHPSQHRRVWRVVVRIEPRSAIRRASDTRGRAFQTRVRRHRACQCARRRSNFLRRFEGFAILALTPVKERDIVEQVGVLGRVLAFVHLGEFPNE